MPSPFFRRILFQKMQHFRAVKGVIIRGKKKGAFLERRWGKNAGAGKRGSNTQICGHGLQARIGEDGEPERCGRRFSGGIFKICAKSAGFYGRRTQESVAFEGDGQLLCKASDLILEKTGGIVFRAAGLGGVFLFFSVSIPALAAWSPQLYGAVLETAPGIVGFFTPVKKSCTDEGIRMEVESAYVEGDAVEIYVSL